jgi:hypothetical protein
MQTANYKSVPRRNVMISKLQFGAHLKHRIPANFIVDPWHLQLRANSGILCNMAQDATVRTRCHCSHVVVQYGAV